FDEVEQEVRRFVRTPIAELADSRESQVVAGIVGDCRIINGQRGKLALFKVDDKSATIEASADEAVINASGTLLRDDEFVVLGGRLQRDPYSGGLRLRVQQVWSLADVRARFGKSLFGAADGRPDVGAIVRDFPPRREETEQGEALVHGLRVRLAVHCAADGAAATAELQLGDDSRFFPCDAALAAWHAQAGADAVRVVYEHG